MGADSTNKEEKNKCQRFMPWHNLSRGKGDSPSSNLSYITHWQAHSSCEGAEVWLLYAVLRLVA